MQLPKRNVVGRLRPGVFASGRRVGFGIRREFLGCVSRLCNDDLQPRSRDDAHGLMPRRMAGCRENLDALVELHGAGEERVICVGEMKPLRHRVALVAGRFVLGSLNVDRHFWEKAVVSAMIEMEGGADNGSDTGEAVVSRFETAPYGG